MLAGEPAAGAKAAPGFVECVIREVVTMQGGEEVVMLVPKGEKVTVPIYIGPAEASAIRMRLEHRTAPRPMTHDLVETMIRSLGGKVTQIQIDDIKDNVYLGKIHLVQGGKTMEIDARPSDSMALALGTGAPIFAARRVIDQAGVKTRELERPRRRERRRFGEPPPDGAEKPGISL
ncbi:MAG: bifunctional nuclease family protein [Myxococcaceae bacterium]